ncbi:hypothetical protein [Streptomyces sp. NBC_00454]|uniref:hypothetical protein n=1 Tax=Streptomyces sp. NBC_00454 TaxID=2975747 RepID=UPI0030E2958B
MTTGSGGPSDRLPMRWLLIAIVTVVVFVLAVEHPKYAVAIGIAIAVAGLLYLITDER